MLKIFHLKVHEKHSCPLPLSGNIFYDFLFLMERFWHSLESREGYCVSFCLCVDQCLLMFKTNLCTCLFFFTYKYLSQFVCSFYRSINQAECLSTLLFPHGLIDMNKTLALDLILQFCMCKNILKSYQLRKKDFQGMKHRLTVRFIMKWKMHYMLRGHIHVQH